MGVHGGEHDDMYSYLKRSLALRVSFPVIENRAILFPSQTRSQRLSFFLPLTTTRTLTSPSPWLSLAPVLCPRCRKLPASRPGAPSSACCSPSLPPSSTLGTISMHHGNQWSSKESRRDHGNRLLVEEITSTRSRALCWTNRAPSSRRLATSTTPLCAPSSRTRTSTLTNGSCTTG